MKSRIGLFILGISFLSCKTSTNPQSNASSASSQEQQEHSADVKSSPEDLANQLKLAADTMANSATCQNPTPENVSVCANAKTIQGQSTSAVQQNVILAPASTTNSIHSYVTQVHQANGLLIAGNCLIILGSLIFLETFVHNVRTSLKLARAAKQDISEGLAEKGLIERAKEHVMTAKKNPVLKEKLDSAENKLKAESEIPESHTSRAYKNMRSMETQITLLTLGAAVEIIGVGLSATGTNRVASTGYNLADEVDTNPDVTLYVNTLGEIFTEMQSIN